MTPVSTGTNAKKAALAQKVLAEMLAEVLRQGYFGTAVLEITVQNGTLQHIRRKIERIDC